MVVALVLSATLQQAHAATVRTVALSGQSAPGTPSGVNFYFSDSSDFPFTPALNDAGQTAFFARLIGGGVINGTNDEGIWSEGSGSLALVARQGSPAPGTPSDVNFNNFLAHPSLNDAGQTAIWATLTGNGVDSTNGRGIWATDRTGVLQLIARTGDPLEVAPGDFRTLSAISFVANTGNSDGRPSAFNNLGQLAFFARFTDGSAGIFVSNRVAVPEPSSLLLAALAAIGLLRCRRVGPHFGSR
jgi:hypothetical protein